jgi:hypothetical protein
MDRSQYIPTDTMQRRVPLPLQRRFLLFGAAVSIKTNSESILRAAEYAGFVAVTDTNEIPEMIWEIVGAEAGREPQDWECNVTLGDHSLYLSMGAEQWFAFDLETDDGVGFVTVRQADHDPNSQRYLVALAVNVGATLRSGVEEMLL